MFLLGITGTHGAGKGTITGYLKRAHGFVCFSVSEFLAAEAVRRGHKPDRIARRTIANEYRAQGPTALMEAVFATIPRDARRVVLEPQYTVEEVRFIQERGGIVLAVDAPLEVRYERVHKRGSAKDDVTFEEFRAAEEAEMRSDDPNKNNLAAAMAAADSCVVNAGTVTELEHVVDRVLT